MPSQNNNEELIKNLNEELQILKTMCEETKRERDCAEKKLKKVMEIIDNNTTKYGQNMKDELRQILTKEN